MNATFVVRGRARRPAVKPTAFTLIELLVVISIIALLIAVLLPVLSSTRETTRRVLCASGQRQAALGTLTYAEDNGEWLPGGYWWIPHVMGGGKEYLPYINAKFDATTFPYLDAKVAKIFECPSKPFLQYDQGYFADAAQILHMTYLYGGGYGGMPTAYPESVNWWGWHHYGLAAYKTPYENPQSPGPVPRLKMRRNLTGSAIFADRMWPARGDGKYLRWDNWLGDVPANHLDNSGAPVGGTATYADGHGSWLRVGEIQDRVMGWYAPVFLY